MVCQITIVAECRETWLSERCCKQKKNTWRSNKLSIVWRGYSHAQNKAV